MGNPAGNFEPTQRQLSFNVRIGGKLLIDNVWANQPLNFSRLHEEFESRGRGAKSDQFWEFELFFVILIIVRVFGRTERRVGGRSAEHGTDVFHGHDIEQVVRFQIDGDGVFGIE